MVYYYPKKLFGRAGWTSAPLITRESVNDTECVLKIIDKICTHIKQRIKHFYSDHYIHLIQS